MADRCVAGGCCVNYDRRSEVPGDATDSPLCEPCLTAGERAVRALVLDYADLEHHLPRSLGQWGDGQPAASDDHPTLLNERVFDLQREIWWVLSTWWIVMAEVDSLSDPPAKTRDGWAVQKAVEILAPRVRDLAKVRPVLLHDYPGLEEGEYELVDGHRQADVAGWRAVVDSRRLHRDAERTQGLVQEYPVLCHGVPCPECDYASMYRLPIREPKDPLLYRCGTCRHVCDENEYERWTGLSAEYAKAREAA